MAQPKVTVYITSHNYGRFLTEAIDSVLRQTLSSWELFVIDDGSHDSSREIATRYAEQHANIETIENDEPLGLRACANEVIRRARGQYIIRLDADDFFDENALLVLASYLDNHRDIGLVFPNWIYVDENGSFLGIENRKKIGTEAQVLDLPAHGACTMVRRRVLKSIGGYDTQHNAQDGHELWLKVLHRYGVANVQTPLFFYRQHGSSMSRDQTRLLDSRQSIKRSLVEKQKGSISPRIVAVVPAKNSYDHLPNVVLEPFAGKPLIDYTIEAASESGLLESIYVFTDDQHVVQHCEQHANVLAEMRAPQLSSPRSTLSQVLFSAVERLENAHSIHPDIIVLLSVHTPLREAKHIQKAIDTLLLYDVDNVISTYEDIDLHFLHGKNGLEPLNPGMLSKLRFEREALYVDNGAVHAFWRDILSSDNIYQGNIGHIVMPRDQSLQIKSRHDRQLAEQSIQLMNERRISVEQ